MADGELFGLDALPLPESLQDAVEHGEAFTRRWVVETILDLVGYTADRDLADTLIVEPACGAGAFLGPIAERLSASCRSHGRSLLDAIHAVEALDLLDHNVKPSRDLVTQQLLADGWEPARVDQAVRAWIGQGDYLLGQAAVQAADYVVGNPPYIRLEDVPDARMSAYRAACPTMGGRADIYIGFYEVGLRSLKPGGRLGFICADRWMRNQYGRRLRELVSRRYGMDLVLTMHDVDAFHEQVSAYPAITIISTERERITGTPPQVRYRTPTICCPPDASRFGQATQNDQFCWVAGWTSRLFSGPWPPARPGTSWRAIPPGCKQPRPPGTPGKGWLRVAPRARPHHDRHSALPLAGR